MKTIRILPEILSNQIAAGEVVQRPASVVKELVENSMDAGADRITIEIEKGGRSLIRISDNGVGLVRDQAMLAVERYATSKIFSKDDLFSISTFGFRGEALPSIASVSKFTLVSRPQNKDSGTRIDIDGGKLKKVADAGAPPGTMVEVRQLFFNTPARRKFLKAESTETSHISDAVSGLAMGNPDIGFRLFLNKKLVRNFPPGQDLIQRARMVLGKDAADNLYPLEADEGAVKITGVCANPAVTRSTPNRIYLFVNHRLVHDRGMVAALFQGYRGRIMKGRYPMGVICVELPFEQVDVNVHPTKREIKFLMPQPVYRLLGRAVEKALADAQADAITYARSGPVSFVGGFGGGNASEPDESGQHTSTSGRLDSGLEKEKKEPVVYGKTVLRQPVSPQVAQGEIKWSGIVPGKSFAKSRPKVSGSVENYKRGQSDASGSDVNMPGGLEGPDLIREPEDNAPAQKDVTETRIVGQVLGTYIVLEKEGHMVLVDQHAAHERVVYERLKKRHRTLGIQSQDLMVPEVLELTHREADILSGSLDEMAALGVNIEPFGGASFVIKSVPVLVKERSIRTMILEMIEQLSRDNRAGAKDDWLDGCLVTMACHRAIRANKPMNQQEMEKLITDLWRCDNPMHCPHGRPILLSFDAYQLEKLFKRVV
ncbi:MAG TPA: DNA mismatch repair endonuclease MutL [Desulfobacteraceae bacterium]|nr:DNA mismatch repair endonuclease MutL [Desulfobacteraceae bacterium]